MVNTIAKLKTIAEQRAGGAGEIAWFRNKNTLVGIDWTAECFYIIDPDNPIFPVLEKANFQGVDIVYELPEEDSEDEEEL